MALPTNLATESELEALYNEVFNRAPDTEGLQYWLGSGRDIGDIRSAFYESPEYQGIQAALAASSGSSAGDSAAPSASSGFTYSTSQGGIGEDQYLSNIKNYVMNVLGNEGMSNEQKAENIRNAANQYGVSNEDIARATGYSIGTVNNYLNPSTYSISTQLDGGATTTGALPSVVLGSTGPSSDEISSIYQDVLKRRPDDIGLNYYLGSGLSADEIRQSLIGSQEYQQMGALQAAQQASAVREGEIRNLYDTLLKRPADEGGLGFWMNSGLSVDEIRNAFLASDEYKAKQPATTGALPAAGAQTTTATTVSGQPATISYFANNKDVADAYVASGAAESMTPEEFAENHWKEHGRYEGRTGPKGEAPNAADKMYDHRGNEYDASAILKLASQIVPNLGSMAGGAFATKGESIGFAYNEAKRILGRDPSAAEQVVLDMARGMLDKGITDISQLSVKDVTSDLNVTEMINEDGTPSGRYFVTYVDPMNAEGGSVTRELTPEEVARITSETITDIEGGQQIRKTANDVLSGKALYAGDKLLSELSGYNLNIGSPLGLDIGGTATGKGSTEYQLIINPTTGKPEFVTYADMGSGMGLLSAALTFASFIPGAQPFAMIANAALAASQGNTLGALASLAGAGGYTNVATALNVANAAKNGDMAALASSLLSNPTIANAAGTTMLTDTISLKDVSTAANIALAANKGDFVGVLNGAANLTGSSDLKTATAAATIVQGVINKNPGAIINGVMQLNNTISAADNLNNKETVNNIINSITNGSITDSGEKDLGATVYTAAKNAGATDEEAMNAAKVITNSTATTGTDTKTTATTGDTKTDIMNGVSQVDTEFGNLDAAIKAATERNTLTIGNADANSLEEAAALAGARGFTNFTYGGKTYAMSATAQEVAAQAAAANIAAAKNFGDAYSLARKELGPGQIFEWNGKKYSTDTREENPSLAAASDQIRYAQLGAGGGRGSYAGYDAKAAADAWSKINTSALDTASLASETFGTMDDFLKSAGLGNEGYVIVGDKISKELFDPVIKTIGTVTRAGGNFLENMAGGLQAVNVIDKDSGIVRIANDMQKWGADRMGDYLIGAEKNVMDRVNSVQGSNAAETAALKFKELGKALWDNPSAIFTLGANEFFEEGGPLAAGGIALKYGGKLAALGVDAFMNAWEAGGANYNDTKKAAINAGMDESAAHTAAQKSAAGAGAVASVLGPVADMPWLKRAGSVTTGAAESTTKAATKAGAKEAITEYPEEFVGSAMSDYFATGTVDLNKAFSQSTVGSVVAGKAVGTITVVSDITSGAGNSTTEIINSTTGSPDQAAALTTAINSSMRPGVDLKAAGADIVTAMEASGMNTAQAQNVANTAVAEQVLNNINTQGGGLNINNLNIAIGTDGQGNAVTLGDFIGSSVTGTGGKVYVAPDIYIGTNANGQPVTVGDLSNLTTVANTKTTTTSGNDTSTTTTSGGVATTNTTNNATGSNTTTTNDAGTGTKTSTTTNQNTGTSTSTAADTKTGSETSTTTNANTGVTTSTSTDTKTGTETTTNINTNTGVNTSTSTNTNTGTNTTTSTDTNTGVTTKTDTNNNTGVTTNTTTNTNTNTNTQTTTNTNTNTETTTNTNTNTNVTTQTTVNNNTGVTTTSTTDTNGNVTSETTTDTNTNTETKVTTNVDTNTQTTTVVDLNTNTVVSETVNTDPVIKKIDPVETVDPVKPETEPEEETEEEKKKKRARRLTTGAPAAAGLMGGDITGISPQMLKSYVTGEKKLDPIAQVRAIQEEMEREAMMQNIDPRLAAVLQQRMGGQQQEDLSGLGSLAQVLAGNTFDPAKAEENEYYAYGKEDPIDDILGAGAAQSPVTFAEGGYVEPLMAQGGMTLPLLAKKGGLPKMVEDREDFRDGKHVAGEGDGQSDDIPAMLADGEFVFPADVVSALGNGSSKAGTDKLYEMMHEIRKRARSTGKKDLPPPALKSPLDYLKSKR